MYSDIQWDPTLLDRSDEEFEKILKANKKKINDAIDSMGRTILDFASFMGGKYTSKIAILKKKEYDAKTSKELELVPPGIKDKILGGFEGDSCPESVSAYDFDANGILHDVEDFLEGQYADTLVAQNLAATKDSIGLLTIDDMGEGTGFLIASDLIMVSRHCLNGSSIGKVTIKFYNAEHSCKIQGVVEKTLNWIMLF